MIFYLTPFLKSACFILSILFIPDDVCTNQFSVIDSNNINPGNQNNIVTENVYFETTDDLELKGKIYYQKKDKIMPGVILMHHLMRSSAQWENSILLKELISEGYFCLTFDFRGHGESEYWNLKINFTENYDTVVKAIKEFVELYAYKDMLSAIDYLKNHNQTDKNKVALIGGSLGANCAINGNIQSGVKAVVAISPSYVGIIPKLKKNNIFYIVGENDTGMGGPNYLNDTKLLFKDTKQPKKLMILPGDTKHGIDCLEHSDINNQIIDWINSQFEE